MATSHHRFAYQGLDNVKMYKYAKFDQNIPCGLTVMSIFTKRPRRTKMMLGKMMKPRHRFAYQCLDNVKIKKYAKFDLNTPCGSRVMSMFTK